MSKEKIKSKYISKESVLYHNELPDNVGNKIKHVIDNANLNDDKFNKVKEIYKEQIDAAVSLIKEGYKIDVFVDDENDISSYAFVGYTYRENLSEDKEELENQKKEFNDKVEQLSYDRCVKDSKDRDNKNVKEMYDTLKGLLVKEGIQYNKKQISILPVILINQYTSYGSMLKLNSNMFDYYYNKIDEFVNKRYSGDAFKNSNCYILFVIGFKRILNKLINGENIWETEDYNKYIEVGEYDVKSLDDYNLFGVETIHCEGISFETLNNIVIKVKKLTLLIPVTIKNDVIENEKVKTIIKKNDNNESNDNKKEYEKEDNNTSKFELRMNNTRYYIDDWDEEKGAISNPINVFNDNIWWEETGEKTKYDEDFCRTSFIVYFMNEINVGLLEIDFNIRFISHKILTGTLNRLDNHTDIRKEIFNVIDKYNIEKNLK